MRVSALFLLFLCIFMSACQPYDYSYESKEFTYIQGEHKIYNKTDKPITVYLAQVGGSLVCPALSPLGIVTIVANGNVYVSGDSMLVVTAKNEQLLSLTYDGNQIKPEHIAMFKLTCEGKMREPIVKPKSTE